MASIPPFCSSGGSSLVARNSFKVPLPPLNPKDPFLNRPINSDTPPYLVSSTLMATPATIHTFGVGAATGYVCLLPAVGAKGKRFMMPNAKAMIQQPRVPSSGLMTGIRAKENNKSQHVDVVKEKSVSVVLLAGGQGKRMGASMPKQYLPLLGQPIALYSFYTFSRMSEVKEIVVVCDPSYQDIFEDARDKINVHLKFALPGKERQDSVYSGLQTIDLNSELVCIHDSARPLVTSGDVEKVLNDGLRVGASVLGVPAKATIKEGNSESFVVKTLDRKTLWEMQTPQVIRPELLKKGFEHVNREGLEVTDDVSIVEHLKHPVYITEGSYTNIKVTTPDDLLLAERILNSTSSVPA